jgi:integrase
MATANELTNLKCLKAKPEAKPYRLSDSGGLFLLVKPTGGKLWRWKYHSNGKERLMAFGAYPEIPLARARLLHAEARAKLAAGIDPMAERQEAKQERREALATKEKKATTELNFENLTQQWFDWWKTDKDQKTIYCVDLKIKKDIVPQFGMMRPEDIRRMDIVNLIRETDKRGAHEVARRNLETIKQIFYWGINNGILDENSLNPAASIRAADILTKTVKGHFARVSLPEVPALVQKLDQSTGYPTTCIGMQVLSLTFLRTTELLSGRWSEINWEEKIWVVPAARMKGRKQEKREHLVPLALQTVAALKRLHALTGHGEYMFPSAKGNSKTMSRAALMEMFERAGYKGRMTGHGWRGVASTFLHERGFDHLHIETQLAHRAGAGDMVAASYNRAKYLEPRRQMMQCWADFLDECRNKATRKISAA